MSQPGSRYSEPCVNQWVDSHKTKRENGWSPNLVNTLFECGPGNKEHVIEGYCKLGV